LQLPLASRQIIPRAHAADRRASKCKSGNPGGRPKIVGEVDNLARAHTDIAINALVNIVKDKKAPH
jgi:hypothetical protein